MRKIIYLLMIIILIFGFCGCNNNTPAVDSNIMNNNDTNSNIINNNDTNSNRDTSDENATVSKNDTSDNLDTTSKEEPSTETDSSSNSDVNIHLHTYTEHVKAATCGSKGYTEHICSCGVVYKDNYTPMTHYHNFIMREKRVGITTYHAYFCKECGMEAVSHGNADGSIIGGNNKIKYYVTYTVTLVNNQAQFSDYHLVVYGSGPMQNYENADNTQWSNYYYDLSKITVAEGITSIGRYAFYHTGINEITIDMADSVKSITYNSIYLNNKSFTLGNGIERVDGIISGQNLNAIYIPRSLKYYSSFGSTFRDENIKIFYEGTKEEFLNIKIATHPGTSTVGEYLKNFFTQNGYPPHSYVYLNCSEVYDRSDFFNMPKEWR